MLEQDSKTKTERCRHFFIGKIGGHPLINKHQWLRQFIKFSIAGGICTLIDFAIYILLTRFFHFWQNQLAWANFISVCSAAVINFVWNKKWTFRDKSPDTVWQYFKFGVVVVGGIIVYQWIFIFFMRSVGWSDLISKAIAAVSVWILRFIFNKFWTFG
jgi:putative flippase GtrA